MKIVFSLLLYCFCTILYSKDKIEVISFKQSLTDIAARTNQRDDTNGIPCALIKVQIPMSNVFFEGDIIGNVAYKTNEYWVYMPEKSSHLDVKALECDSISIEFAKYGISSVESNGTYKLCLLKEKKDATQLYNDGMIALAQNDISTAFNCLLNASDSGYSWASYILGTILVSPYQEHHEKDPNLIESYNTSFKYLLKAAQDNIPDGLYSLGNFLLKYNKTKKILQESPENAIWESNIYKIMVPEELRDSATIWGMIRKAADYGISDAQWQMLSNEEWCIENAKKGIAIAEFGMGIRCDSLYEFEYYDFPKLSGELLEGKNRTINMKKAFEWYNKAANHGLDAAQWKLGYMYALGKGTEKNIEKSLYWRNKAADQGYVVYQLEMAMSYIYGEISDLATFISYGTSELFGKTWTKISKDYDKADYWLRKVSNHDFTYQEEEIINTNNMYDDAMSNLSSFFIEQRKYNKAIYWLQRGVERGKSFRNFDEYNLGELYFKGKGIEKNYDKARALLEKATDNEKANCLLGIMYRDGIGVSKNIGKAKEYFFKSINDLGGVDARYELAMIYISEKKYDLARRLMRDTSYNDDRKSSTGQYFFLDNYLTLLLYHRGILNYDGLGGKKDIERAISDFKEAARRSYEPAKKKLEELGIPVPQEIQVISEP